MKKQHEKMLRKCFNKHADAVYRLCLFRLHGDEMLAMDLVQEAFYRTGMELSKGVKIKNIKAFIFRIASNLVIDHTRKAPTQSIDEQEEEGLVYAQQSSPEGQVHAQVELERMYAILDDLPKEDRDLFLLRYVEGMSPKKIASLYAIDVNALTVRLHRIKKKVSLCMSF